MAARFLRLFAALVVAYVCALAVGKVLPIESLCFLCSLRFYFRL
jgi:hypothetical protein